MMESVDNPRERFLQAVAYAWCKDRVEWSLSTKLDDFAKTTVTDYSVKIKEIMNAYKMSAPVLLAKRFQNQIFDQLCNGVTDDQGDNLCVTNYDNEDNSVIFKAIPAMDWETINNAITTPPEDRSWMEKGIFASSLNQTLTFKYPQCVIDLNPTPTDYAVTNKDEENNPVEVNPGSGKFPITFTAGIKPNEGEEGDPDAFKTSKIVMNMVKLPSGESSV